MSIIKALDIARSGLTVQEKQLAVHAQNLAGQAADSYKRQYGVAYDLPYQDDLMVGAPLGGQGNVNPTGAQIGMGVRIGGIYQSFEQGEMEQTGQAFDIAIQGKGFYQVTLLDGTTAYTRVASFQISPQGQLQTLTGYNLVPNITIPIDAKEIKISEDGQVSILLQGQDQYQQVGQIQIATFINPNGLRHYGDSVYTATEASGTANIGTPATEQFGAIKQGWREGSNVNMVEELTGIIQTEKVYQSILKAVRAGETMMSSATEIGRA